MQGKEIMNRKGGQRVSKGLYQMGFVGHYKDISFYPAWRSIGGSAVNE